MMIGHLEMVCSYVFLFLGMFQSGLCAIEKFCVTLFESEVADCSFIYR